MDKLLIVFVKHPELGKVKTRLAKTLGKEKALSIYKNLLLYTRSICKAVNTDIHIYYTEEVIKDDIWNDFEKSSQSGQDLGERMFNAFKDNQNYSRKVIIGSDCFEITPDHIEQAFNSLSKSDTVLGPANDGGYYLFGMNEISEEYFSDIEWSTEEVLNQTIDKINSLNKSHSTLETLVDIDTEDDLKKYKHYEQIISRNH